MTRPLKNPERHWTSPNATRAVTEEELRARLGDVERGYEVLGGGHANTNVRLNSGPILRIYRRDMTAAQKEKSLFGRPWAKLRVPEVLGSGPDFLVLEYVEHAPLEGSAEHGAAVGWALAEIHRHTFEQAGFLGPDASIVREPFDDVLASFCEYIDSCTSVARKTRDRVLDFLNARRGEFDALARHPVLLHGDFKVSNLHWTPGRTASRA